MPVIRKRGSSLQLTSSLFLLQLPLSFTRFAHGRSPLTALPDVQLNRTERLGSAGTECVRFLHLAPLTDVSNALVPAYLDNLDDLLVVFPDTSTTPDVGLAVLHLEIHVGELHEACPPRHDNCVL